MSRPEATSPTQPVWRVGRVPDPWAWPAPEFAYGQRWDDSGRAFRTVYAGDTPVACFIEVLAHARPGLTGDPDYDSITVDDADQNEYPTPAPGIVDPDWLASRLLAEAVLAGSYCDVTRTVTIQALRSALLPFALEAGFPDFDGAALKTAGASGRKLTQHTATYLYNQARGNDAAFDGVHFTSRHGEEHSLWAIFERPDNTPTSPLVTPISSEPVDPASGDLAVVFEVLNLTWPTSG